MKKIISAILLIIAVSVNAQMQDDASVLNNYKYVIVPSKFGFQKTPDQYRLNTFTKLYLEKYGFVVFLDTDMLPLEAGGDNCNKLFADVVSESNMFITKLSVVLRDCMNKEVYRTGKGTSREKNFEISYRQSLRDAVRSFETINYAHNGKDGIRGEIGHSGTAKANLKTAPEDKIEEIVITKNTLFAQPVENGFQLVDQTPKVIFMLRKTSSSQVYLAEKEGQSGTLIDKGKGKWVFEYYLDGKLITEEVSVKF